MPVVYEGDDEAPEEGGTRGDLSAGDDSMRVMYEDPGQRDEKRRLMSLLGGSGPDGVKLARETANLSSGVGGGEGSTTTATATKRRTSTRIAGF